MFSHACCTERAWFFGPQENWDMRLEPVGWATDADFVPDPARWRPKSLRAARAAWIERMSAEHRSFPVFASLASQLSEAGATFDAEAVMLRMAQDEIRHAELCGVVVGLAVSTTVVGPVDGSRFVSDGVAELERRALAAHPLRLLGLQLLKTAAMMSAMMMVMTAGIVVFINTNDNGDDDR